MKGRLETSKQTEERVALEGRDLLKQVLVALEEKKAQRTVAFDLTGQYLYTDYIVITQGTSDRHLQTIADGLLEHLSKFGVEPLGIEGYSAAQWILIDLNDVVVHVFLEPVRAFYDLEGLWSRMPELDVAKLLEEAEQKSSQGKD